MRTRSFLRIALLLITLFGLRTTLAAPPSWSGPPDWAGQPGGRPTLNYHALYVFGDSLSDTGNDHIWTKKLGISPPIPPSISPYRIYWEGRFSNGPVAIEYLWRALSRKGEYVTPSLAAGRLAQKAAISYAYGGTRSGGLAPTAGGFPAPGVLAQVDLFEQALEGKKANKHALYVVWTGANDYLFPETGLGTPPPPPDTVVGNIVSAISTLYRLGAREFLVPNLPDFSLSPLVESDLKPLLSQLILVHNATLAQALGNLALELPGASFYRPDTYALMHQLIDNRTLAPTPPALEYLTHWSGASLCLIDEDPAAPPNYPDLCRHDIDFPAELPPLMFWDVLHPTTAAHERLGRAMYESLQR